MEDIQRQVNIIYVSASNAEPRVRILLLMDKRKTIKHLKELVWNTLGKKSIVLSEIIIACIFNKRIVCIPKDEEELELMANDHFSLFAFEMNSAPSGYTCVECLQECDTQLTVHASRLCQFFMSDACMKNYFHKDQKHHICPVCKEEVEVSMFSKSDKSYSFVSLWNVPILLRHNVKDKEGNSWPKLFGYPRLLKLPTYVNATELFEHVRRVVPEGKYSLHMVDLEGILCSLCSEERRGKPCAGCKIIETGIVVFTNRLAIAVHYSGNIPKMSPPLLHSIAAKKSSHHRPQSDAWQIVSETNGTLQSFEHLPSECDPSQPVSETCSNTVTAVQKILKHEDFKSNDPNFPCNSPSKKRHVNIRKSVWPSIDYLKEENSVETGKSEFSVPPWMSKDNPELQPVHKNGHSEIKASSGTDTLIWEDYFGFKYEVHETNGKKFYKCTTDKIWSSHAIESGEQPFTKVQNFDVFLGESVKSVYVDVNTKPVNYEVLGPITVSKQFGKQLIINTCASFRSSHYLFAGQVLFVKTDDFFKPISIVTCSIPEENEYRYIISNYKEQIVCLSCQDKIEEVSFYESRSIADDADLNIYFWEQCIENKERILRFLNKSYAVVYTVWDSAVKKYDTLTPTYH